MYLPEFMEKLNKAVEQSRLKNREFDASQIRIKIRVSDGLGEGEYATEVKDIQWTPDRYDDCIHLIPRIDLRFDMK